MAIFMEPRTSIPILSLDDEPSESLLSTVKSLGYCYIPRSSLSFGEIPDGSSLKLLIDELFQLTIENKMIFGSDLIRSVDFDDPPTKKETITVTKSSRVLTMTKSLSLKSLFYTCQQLSIYLGDLFQLTNELTSTTKNTLLINHYSKLNEPLVIPIGDNPFLRIHLLSTSDFQRFDSDDHQWKSLDPSIDSNEYMLVTLPDLKYRCGSNEASTYTLDYIAYNTTDLIANRTYWCSLKQNKVLRYITFFYLYVMQGVPAGFSSTALANYLTAEGEQSSTVGTFVSLSSLPWALQFVWGPLIDRFQSSPMGRRRPWVIGSQTCAFLASLGLLFVRDPKLNIQTLVIAFFVHSIFASIQDASVDAQAITTIPLNERGRINGFMRGGFLVGSALGAAGLAWILRNQNYFTAAAINSAFLLTFTVITFFIKENSDDQLFPCTRKKSSKLQRRHQLKHDYSILKLFHELFKGLLSWPSLRLFIPILIVYASQAAFIRAYNIHLIKVLEWSDTSVSILSGAWGTLIVLAVALAGGWLADRIGARRLLIIVIFIHASYMLSANLLEPYWKRRPVATAILILWNMMDPILSTASMPVLMSLCRTHVEGSQFTTYMSLVNLCDLAGAFISGHLQQHFRANIIGLGCAVLIIIALIIVTISVWYDRRLAHRIHSTDANDEQSKTTNSENSVEHCGFINRLRYYNRGSFKIIAQRQ